jgi:hypothetical protein
VAFQGELGVLTITGDVVKVAVNHALLKFFLLVTMPSVDEAVAWYVCLATQTIGRMSLLMA